MLYISEYYIPLYMSGIFCHIFISCLSHFEQVFVDPSYGFNTCLVYFCYNFGIFFGRLRRWGQRSCAARDLQSLLDAFLSLLEFRLRRCIKGMLLLAHVIHLPLSFHDGQELLLKSHRGGATRRGAPWGVGARRGAWGVGSPKRFPL